MNLNLNTAHEVFFTLELLEAGKVVRTLPRQRNLIVDSGLDLLATTPSIYVINRLHWGTGNLVTFRSTGAITVAAAAGVLTASAGYFLADDVGRILKLDTGEEYRIASVTSATSATSENQTAAAAVPAKMWYANLTSLVAEVGTVDNPYSNVWTTDADGHTMRQTLKFLSAPFGTQRTVTELGWGPSTAVFFGMKEIIAFPVLAGQQIRVTVEHCVDVSPTTAAAVGNVGSQVDTTGTLSIDHHARGRSIGAVLEPSAVSRAWCMTWNFNQTPLGAVEIGDNPVAVVELANGTYVAGTFCRHKTGTIAANTHNGNVYGVALGMDADYSNRRVVSVKFAAPQPITLEQKVQFDWLLAWNRKLTN